MKKLREIWRSPVILLVSLVIESYSSQVLPAYVWSWNKAMERLKFRGEDRCNTLEMGHWGREIASSVLLRAEEVTGDGFGGISIERLWSVVSVPDSLDEGQSSNFSSKIICISQSHYFRYSLCFHFPALLLLLDFYFHDLRFEIRGSGRRF